MCFMLYAGTLKRLTRREWSKESPDVSVRDLVEAEFGIKVHFSHPEVQFIGSTSGCGCDFPKSLLRSGIWPDGGDADGDLEYLSTCRKNCGRLFEVLHAIDGNTVELYGVWAGDESETPMVHETIRLSRIVEPDFYFKERGFYEVQLRK